MLFLNLDDILLLSCGRRCAFDMAHPLARHQAVVLAAESRPRPVHLVEAGRFPNAAARRLHEASARFACRTVKHHFLVDPDVETYDDLRSAADIFCSFTDGFQETFGLTPLEAMAAGLPVVVSDWDGYRDTVRDGIDGFCVPTLMPSPGSGQDLADRYADGADALQRYSGYTSQMVAIDVQAAAGAFEVLIQNPDLRQRFGAAGSRRAREIFDWPVVMAQYDHLWSDLAARRRAAGDAALGGPGGPRTHPGRVCPFDMFASYATRTIAPDDTVSLTAGFGQEHFDALCTLDLVSFAKTVMPRDDELRQILEHLIRVGPLQVATIVELFPSDRRCVVERGLVWLHKLNIVQIV